VFRWIRRRSFDIHFGRRTDTRIIDFASFGGFSYRLSPNYFGSDSFTYKANDGIRDGNVATVFLTVLPINDAPVAAGDSYTTDEDVALTITAAGVLGNDSDVENDRSAPCWSPPGHGSLILNGNGSFTYTPDANYDSPDGFRYKANDGSLDRPSVIINGIRQTTHRWHSLTGQRYEDRRSAGSRRGCRQRASCRGLPAHGRPMVMAVTTRRTQFRADSFSYKANDGSLDSNIAVVQLTVNPVNDAPVAQDGSASGDEDTPISGQVVATDVDNSADQLSYSVVSGPSHGTLMLSGTGAFTYTPTANYNGSDSFSYKAYDGNLYSNIAAISLAVP
jgi:hypothetical protein